MMENKVYRPQIRLYRDRPADKIIIEKIENRNPMLHKTVMIISNTQSMLLKTKIIHLQNQMTRWRQN